MLKKRVLINKTILNLTWSKLREDFYKITSPSKYNNDLRLSRRIEGLKIEITALYAAINYYEMSGNIHDAFEAFGYKIESYKDIERVKLGVRQKQTQLNMMEAKLKKREDKDDVDSIDYWKMAIDLQTAGTRAKVIPGALDFENINMAEWANYINQIKIAS